MLKRLLCLMFIICMLFPLTLGAAVQDAVDDVKDIKKDIEKAHKKDIGKELKKLDKGFNVDLNETSFSSDTQAGLTNMTGNTSSLAVNGTNVTKYRYHRFEHGWNLGAYYSRTFSSSSNQSLIGTSAKYIYGNYMLNYYIMRRFTVFWGGGGYTNELKGMEVAGQGYTGFKYYFLMEKNYYFSGALGYNFTYENVIPPDRNRKINSIAVMLDYEQNITDNLKIEQHIEVLEDVKSGKEIRVNSHTGLRVSITKYLGIGLNFIVLFDNEPPRGYRKLDTITNFSMSVAF